MHKGKDLTEVRSEHKETRAGHVGLEPHEPTSLRGIAIRAKESKENFARRESEYNRGTGCGKTARPGLCGGPLVTEVPAVRGIANHQWGKLKLVAEKFKRDTLWIII